MSNFYYSFKFYLINISVEFELFLTSQGEEDVEVIPRIEIESQDNILETLEFQKRLVKNSIKFHFTIIIKSVI